MAGRIQLPIATCTPWPVKLQFYMTQSQQPIFADNSNRITALILDMLLLACLTAVVPITAESLRQYALFVLYFLYFFGMPLTPLQGTLGKRICRIKICDRQGRKLVWRASLLRAMATTAWLSLPIVFGAVLSASNSMNQALTELWWMLCLLPWASIGFMPRHESLFDLLASSLVVINRANPESIAEIEPARKHFLNGLGLALACLLMGLIFYAGVTAYHERNLHSRITYALNDTRPLCKSIEAFHGAEQRWPTAGELGIPDWNPYPDGGGYHLQANGNVVITFSVLPELKGHSITLVPKQTENGQITWQCSADAGLERRYLPRSCR